MIGCATLSHTPPHERPADFALSFYVWHAGERNMLFLVTPDRSLRVAVGADVPPDLYPPTTMKLTPAQMDELWLLVPREGVSPAARAGPIEHTVTVTSRGRTHRVVVEPGFQYDPLLAKLRTLAGV